MTTERAAESAADSAALNRAAAQALYAPSVFNTQPWRWRTRPGRLELYADRSRRLDVTDPDGRLLILSCGAALHHARTVLSAVGYAAEVIRMPDPSDPDLLARIRIVARRPADPVAVHLAAAIPRRRTDRRAFGEAPVPPRTLDRLQAVVEAEGAHLHVVKLGEMPLLAVATAKAATTELADPAYRAELIRWTNRPPWSGDGVPVSTAVERVPRRVPIRDFAIGVEPPGLDAGRGNDRGASYVVLFGLTDEPAAWLRAGEALSALLLTATVEGLSAAPLSDVIEVVWPRQLMRGLLAGVGEPYLAIRLGAGSNADDLPPVPRRQPDEVIEHEAQD